MKTLICILLVSIPGCTLLSGCSVNVNRTSKIEASWHILRKGEPRPRHVDFDNQSTGNATDKALRGLKRRMRL